LFLRYLAHEYCKVSRAAKKTLIGFRLYFIARVINRLRKAADEETSRSADETGSRGLRGRVRAFCRSG
jgi:hypothetical protein